MQEKIILASASPRRKELLQQIGMQFVCKPSDVEEVITKTLPQEVVEELSEQKAQDIVKREQGDCIVIGSDTVVACDDKILGKPKDRQDAVAMLQMLSGRNHQVYTGVTLLHKKGDMVTKKVFHECTQVYVYPMSLEEIKTYVESGESDDKAGSYGIQGSFAAYIEKIEGDYYNVVGLPIGRVYQELKRII